ncbi:MAG: glycosyltransferase [Candidatus Omnitrophica bacterium]|nr:glycosyltransferase [Candidatus Omnitrophota bacterium]
MNPRLTVLMTVYNGAPYLRTSVESVLGQTHSDFRFLIIDDASRDDTVSRVRSFKDDRIDLVRLTKNIGQTAALNVGFRRASTPWIARMDADDYSAPNRLEEQMRLLQADPSLGCVGTFAWEFREDPHEREGIVTRPVGETAIREGLLQGAPMIHGSMVIHREALLSAGGYNERYRYSADREMFHRIFKVMRGANVPQPLLGLRRHASQGSFSPVAADENIEIFSEMLGEEGFSAQERSIVRRSLAFSHLFRARCALSERNYGKILQSVGSALRISPRSTLRSLVSYPMAHGIRAKK